MPYSTMVRDLRLRFELRNSQPQFVFCFCDFLDVNLQDFVSKFLARYFTKFKGRACPLLGLSKNLKARAGKEIFRGRDVPSLVERTICYGV